MSHQIHINKKVFFFWSLCGVSSHISVKRTLPLQKVNKIKTVFDRKKIEKLRDLLKKKFSELLLETNCENTYVHCLKRYTQKIKILCFRFGILSSTRFVYFVSGYLHLIKN